MIRHPLKVRWAGPFVLALLLVSAVVSRAPAALVLSGPPVTSSPATAAAATVDEKPDCFKYAVAYVTAYDEYLAALSEWYYYVSDPFFTGGDAAEQAAERLDQATEMVVLSGVALAFCLLLL